MATATIHQPRKMRGDAGAAAASTDMGASSIADGTVKKRFLTVAVL